MADEQLRGPVDLKLPADFVQHVREVVLPAVQDSTIFLSLCPDTPDGKLPDINFLVQLGAAVWYGKPILAVALPGRTIPPGLRQVASRSVENVDITKPEGQEALKAALLSMDALVKATGEPD